MSTSRTDILKLYKNLILYSKTLRFTDVNYFKRRIRSEFKKNKTLNNSEDISYAIKAKLYFNGVVSYKMLTFRILNNVNRSVLAFQKNSSALKHTIDFSKVPKINECDLTEQFVRGSGPGGSAVNKNSNCVVLTHIPTGIVIKCHTSRSQDENRKMARDMLIAKLDDIINGKNSVESQKKMIEENRFKKVEYKKKKRAEIKEKWKKREGLI
ncbi:hypothetical protein KGM_212169 [Danaus plexippus plexippus]|uniref:Uncharacterized protein n=1 Tax=Danaus plexippus plexippus TaxID=278856 RepID=A0A212FD70_DANPL|nr:hypothetical protein KGM_212169 [Danaus plexippus plexippus]